MAESIAGRASIADIPTDTVQESLRQTMVMGLPEVEAYRPTFYFEPDRDWDPEDAEGSPWDWTATPTTEVSTDPVQVLCAIDFSAPLGRQGAFQTEVGEFNPNTVVLSMFQEEFDQVFGFSYVTIGPELRKFFFRFWRPAVALNDMAFYEVHAVAQGVE